jgi:transposase
MFIRSTSTTKKNKTYLTYKLVESRRVDGAPRQRTLLNLGADFDLPRDEWKPLADRIEEILRNVDPLLEPTPEIEALAQRYAKVIIEKFGKNHLNDDSSLMPETSSNSNFETVDVNSMEHRDSRTIGAEALVWQAALDIQLPELLDELGFNKPQKAAALGNIIGRAVHPGSELRTHAWLQNNSAIGELIEYDFSNMGLNQLYRTSDLLNKNKDLIEDKLRSREVSLFNLKGAMVLYDLTNTFFEGTAKAVPKAKFGRSKEKRSDCRLVTLAMVLDEHGFARRSKIFEGNVTESQTLEEMIDELKEENEDPFIVFDAGIATEENLNWAHQNGYTFIVVSRATHDPFDETKAKTIRDDGKNKIVAYSEVDKETKETLVYCHSEQKEKKENSIKDKFTQNFEEDLKELNDGLSKKRRMKKYVKVVEKIGRLREKNKRVSKNFEINVIKDENSENAKEITWKIRDDESKKNSGSYVLRTNSRNLPEFVLWNLYRMLNQVEDTFRSMKSELGMRPIFHQKEKRVESHLFITVLAYRLVHAILFRLNEQKIYISWDRLRFIMSSQIRTTIQMKTKDEKTISVRLTGQPTAEQQTIYNALGQNTKPLKAKTLVLKKT